MPSGLRRTISRTLAAAPRVFLTRALKADGAPTVPSRWLQRLIQLTGGLKLDKQLHDDEHYAALARELNAPIRAARMKKPRPRPPVEARPRGLSVTEIEKWLRDPYWIYARHVLRLRPLDPLDAEVGPPERGIAIHAALEAFLREAPSDALADHLIAVGDRTFAEARIPRATLAVWRPRFVRAARWFAGIEQERREQIAQSFVELKGLRIFDGPAGPFELRCRADRIDRLTTGEAAIMDYKTGRIPSKRQVATLMAPQLPLEGADPARRRLQGNGSAHRRAASLCGHHRRRARPASWSTSATISTNSCATSKRNSRTGSRRSTTPPPPIPHACGRSAPTDVGDYDHLSRVREWSLTGWDGEDE